MPTASWPEDLSLDELMVSYVFANTAGYIMSRFRRSPIVVELSSRFDAEVLGQLVIKYSDKTDRDETDVVRAYAALVAFSSKCDSRSDEVLRGLSLGTLRWAERIREAILAEHTPANVLDVNLGAPAEASQSKTESLATSSVTNQSGEFTSALEVITR